MEKGIKFYKEYELGHLTFFTAKDVSYITEDMAQLLKTYHDATTPIKKRKNFKELSDSITFKETIQLSETVKDGFLDKN